ncbi:MAG: UDP-N-acetylmuramoyl-L-alanyl-D-glutamate--2,6-diaminopimelate ligase [Sideroxyarcus sp.]|nr:UDP-N-acetylmuramoyl-L-alanyl-D-glutamate--2,6-diaminopimelate ligase [Sideroxyarcus sp.]
MNALRLDELSSLGVAITRLVADSREVRAGDTFVAYPGARADGRRYIAQAIARGANAVIWDAHDFAWDPAWRVPHLALHDLRQQAGFIADKVYGQPSRRLQMVGVTGTNGKTSISHWLAKSFSACNKKCALIGTLGNGFADALQASANTTPDALRIHELLAQFVREAAQATVMEVSSHALAQGRVNGVHFDVALLTNLTRDHLDYHGDMQHYAAAKRRLFDWDQLGHAVLNLDDSFGAELALNLHDGGRVEVVGYGLQPGSLELARRRGLRMVQGALRQADAQGLQLRLQTSWGEAELHSHLLGRFNASNLLGALAVLLVSGVPLDDAVRELGMQRAVAGRMQAMGGRDVPTVVVDYAHTPDALENVLATLREVSVADGRLICVFGCGGDRDRGKRPMMGKVADRFADARIITSDNPRSETPRAIIDEIAAGMTGQYRVIEDRAHAINVAIAGARACDTVLIAGKGHEEYQEIAGVRQPFSDSEIAQRALSVWVPKERWPT